MTSSSVAHEHSISKEINSFKCLYVSCFSALNAGPISKTLSRPPDMHNCLKSCGDWLRNAGVSKYCIGNKSVPPSVAVATIFGVWVSKKPSLISASLPYCRIFPRSLNIAAMWARLKSKNRLSNLVSSSTWTVSVTPRGKGASAFAITTTDSAITS